MQYIILFLEGVMTFVSPCLLPMLPIYLTYFAAGEAGRARVLKKRAGFVLGFTLVFVALGALASVAGRLLIKYQTWVNLGAGAVIVLLGLSFLGMFHIGLFSGTSRAHKMRSPGFFASAFLGAAFSLGWTPCVGAFLGTALMMASAQGSVLPGILMLLCYSAGLGVPFILSAVLIDRLKGAFDFIKRHYKTINIVCGAFLILIGAAMMTGLWGRLLNLIS